MTITSLKSWCSGVVRDARVIINIEEAHGADKLVRHMGLFSVGQFTITQAVGAGILTNPGIIARDFAGSQSYMSFLWAGLISTNTMLLYIQSPPLCFRHPLVYLSFYRTAVPHLGTLENSFVHRMPIGEEIKPGTNTPLDN
jgi:hypothetical protein